MSISIIQRHQIDTDLWDDVILNSPSGHIYGLSWYLDAVTDAGWSAIMTDDYHSILPIFAKRKWGLISYFYRPYLSQQLGIFSKNPLIKSTQDSMMLLLQKRLRVIDITIHGDHHVDDRFTSVTNHILSIPTSIEQIREKYNRNTKRNLIAALQVDFQVTKTDNPSDTIPFLVQHQPFDMNEKEQKIVSRLLMSAQSKGVLDIFWLNSSGEHRCLGVCMRFKKRIYFLLIASDPFAKDNGLTFALIDHMIAHYAGEYEVFDFTGSQMKSIAQRNEGFGAYEENYYRYQKRWFYV